MWFVNNIEKLNYFISSAGLGFYTSAAQYEDIHVFYSNNC